jgi:hypothetical protein
VATTIPPILAKPVAIPAQIPDKIVPNFDDKKPSLKFLNKITDNTIISAKATNLLIWTSRIFVKNRPIGNPLIAPSHKIIEVPLSDSFQPFLIIKSPATNSIHQQIGMSSMGGMIVTAKDITKADKPKPEKPLISPAKKQIRIKNNRSVLFNANMSTIVKGD